MLVRDRPLAGLEVYMTRRSARSRFVPDAYVFPGGRVDAADAEPPRLALLVGEVAGCRPEFLVAALRELLEEAGVLVACAAGGAKAAPAPELLRELRAELAGGAEFAHSLASRGLFLDARELTYYSNWITPQSEPLRFDVHFFIARAPHGQEAAADAVEVHDGRWLAPADALARAQRGELSIIFPTRKHLERLAACANVDALAAHARVRRISPVHSYQREDGEFDVQPGCEAW
jgi:8-oxo-dGTP pyrophosphatase MutT (NUDIX family)